MNCAAVVSDHKTYQIEESSLIDLFMMKIEYEIKNPGRRNRQTC